MLPLLPTLQLIHWRAKEARLLAPFYAFVLHADEVADRYHKRLLRDLMHYPEEVYCKASQVLGVEAEPEQARLQLGKKTPLCDCCLLRRPCNTWISFFLNEIDNRHRNLVYFF